MHTICLLIDCHSWLEEALWMAYLRNGRNVIRQIIKDTNIHSSDSDRMINPLLYACQGIRYRKLEVILTTSVEKLGKAGQTVKVAPGHFRNHLMPKLLAVPNIDKYAYLIKQQRKNCLLQEEEEEEEEEVKVVTVSEEAKQREYQKAAKILANSRLVLRRSINLEKFRTRATKEDAIELKSPVTTEDLVAEVARQLCVHILPENVHLPSPLLTVGEYEVPLRLPKSIPLPAGKIQWTLNVKIRTA
ncbi:hypothetical protein L3X38_015107 [Prunus dulcis]|uniref:Large ribosomal subunit protein bL9c n=1 Tax=Prunus dulcis TaxID=3755 RepID=A0AAD4ZJ34_PRUDU|nr:hypothetical protein L3X38_015107 [Prunus dulcis]